MELKYNQEINWQVSVITQLTMLRWANVGSGRIGRGRKANVEPRLDQRLQFTSGNG